MLAKRGFGSQGQRSAGRLAAALGWRMKSHADGVARGRRSAERSAVIDLTFYFLGEAGGAGGVNARSITERAREEEGNRVRSSLASISPLTSVWCLWKPISRPDGGTCGL